MLNKKNHIASLMMTLKILLFLFIIVSPLVSLNKYVSFLNHTISKIIMLAIIVGLCFIDFQLAILATIAFLILMIHLNKNISSMITKDAFMNSEKLLDMQFAPPMSVPPSNTNLVCGGQQQQQEQRINKDMMSHFIDDKIKPYDMFISMMTDEQALARAQGELL